MGKGEYYDLGQLVGICFALDVGAEDVEVVGEGEGFEGLVEGHFGSADFGHGQFVVEVDVVVSFLECVGVVVGMLVDDFDLLHEGLFPGFEDVHL